MDTDLNRKWNGWGVMAGVALVLLVVIAYLPMFTGGFIWDDVDNITNNPYLRSLGGLKKIWLTRGAGQQYYPLTFTNYWLDYHLWRLNPSGYHVENVMLHALCAVLLWRVLKLLNVGGAWLGAALFAVHPVCAESVAWVTERRNMLSGIFVLGSVWAAMKFWLPGLTQKKSAMTAESPREDFGTFPGPWRYYLLAVALYVCALWSKTAAVGVPAVILFLLWWKRGDLGWRGLRWFIPFLMAGLTMALITIRVERRIGAASDAWTLSIAERCFMAARAVWFYLGKLVWPHPLMVIYPRWAIQTGWFSGCLALLAIGACLWVFWRKRNEWGRPALTVAGCFAAMLFPVMGFFNVAFFRFSLVSDHFQYLACMAPLALAGAAIWTALKRFGSFGDSLRPAVCGTIMVLLGFLAWRQDYVYLDNESLWRAAAQTNPGAWVAQNNLGLILADQGKLDEAMEHLNEALRFKPDFPEALNNQGLVLARKGEVDAAIGRYSAALAMGTNYVPAQYNIGISLMDKGRYDEAIAHLSKCAELVADPRVQLALADAMAGKGSLEEAMGHYNRAIELNPGFEAAYKNKALTLAKKGDLDPARDCLTTAVRMDPRDAEAHFNLGILDGRMNQSAEAIEQYKETLGINPRMWGALNNLAWILASDSNPQLRDGAEAVRLAEQACQLTGNREAVVLGTLGAAYAEAGRFEESVDAAKKAEALASAAGQKEVADKNHKMVELFSAKQPFHEQPASAASRP